MAKIYQLQTSQKQKISEISLPELNALLKTQQIIINAFACCHSSTDEKLPLAQICNRKIHKRLSLISKVMSDSEQFPFHLNNSQLGLTIHKFYRMKHESKITNIRKYKHEISILPIKIKDAFDQHILFAVVYAGITEFTKPIKKISIYNSLPGELVSLIIRQDINILQKIVIGKQINKINFSSYFQSI